MEFYSARAQQRLRFLLPLTFIFAVFALVGAGCTDASTVANSTTEANLEAQEAQPQRTWQEVATWTGTGMKTTESFSITGRQWRINWASTDTTGSGYGTLAVHVNDLDGNLIALAANAMGTASDTSYVYQAGEFYLNILSGNSNWKITVEELK